MALEWKNFSVLRKILLLKPMPPVVFLKSEKKSNVTLSDPKLEDTLYYVECQNKRQSIRRTSTHYQALHTILHST